MEMALLHFSVPTIYRPHLHLGKPIGSKRRCYSSCRSPGPCKKRTGMGWYDVVGRRVCSLLHFHNNVHPGSRQAVKRKDPFSRNCSELTSLINSNHDRRRSAPTAEGKPGTA